MVFFERVSGLIVCWQRRLVWQFSTGDLVLSTPTIDEGSGTCVVGSVDRRMYALDLASGEQRWNVTTGGGIEGTPAVVSGAVYVGSRDGAVHALDAISGALRWKFAAGAEIRGGPAASEDHSVLVAGSGRCAHGVRL